MDTLKSAKKLAVLSALIEGCSIRAASRMTGVHKTTIMKLLSAAGKRCQELHNEQVYAVRCEAVECDEIWTFIQKKQRRLTEQDPLIHPDYGDIYTFVAFEPVSKVVIAYAVGKRDASTANNYILDLRQRVTGRPQISTDAFAPYIDAVEQAFGSGVDYAQIVKLYAGEHPGPGRYSPPHVVAWKFMRSWEHQ